jgi:hypothetical protein
LDSTNTKTIGNTNPDITFLTPISSPGVLDDVVFLTILDAVANSKDGVIKTCATRVRSDNTTGVVMEHFLVSLDCYRNGLFGNSSLELILSV